MPNGRARFVLFLFVLYFLMPCLSYAKTLHEAMAGDSYIEGEALVGIRQPLEESGKKALEFFHNARLLGAGGVYLYKIPGNEKTLDFIARMKGEKIKGVKYIEPNYTREFFYAPMPVPNDPFYRNGAPYDQWNINIMQVDSAWNEALGNMSAWARGNTGTVIAIDDSGVNASHEDLVSKLIPGRNFSGVGAVNDTTDNYFHGTAVASLAGAGVNNALGIAGTAAEPLLMPLKIGDVGPISTANCALAIIYAADSGVKVINMSYGGYSPSQAESDACAYAAGKGVIMVAASGNDNLNLPTYPSNYDNVMCIGASTRSDIKSDYSNYGPGIDFLAPAGNSAPPDAVVCAKNNNNTGYGAATGTSFSCPQAAGLAAVLYANGVPWYQAVSRMARTCDKIGTYPYAATTGKTLGTWNQFTGYGRLNFYRAMKTLVPPVNLVITNTIGSITLGWQQPDLFDTPTNGYNIYRASAIGGPFTLIGFIAAAPRTYDDFNVTSGTTYYYVVKAVDSNGFETRGSNIIGGTAGTVLTETFTPSAIITLTATPTITATVTNTISITCTQPTAAASPTASMTSTAAPVGNYQCVRLDPSFNGSGVAMWSYGACPPAETTLADTAIDNQGRIIGVGATVNDTSLNTRYMVILRYQQDGQLDTGFNGTGYVIYPSYSGGESVVLDGQGRIVVAGYSGGGMTLWRYNPDGSPDTTFNGSGIVTKDGTAGFSGADVAMSVKIDGSGKLVVCGYGYRTSTPSYLADMIVWRFNSNGQPDLTFNGTGSAFIYNSAGRGATSSDRGFDLAIDSAGKIIITGHSYDIFSGSSDEDLVVWRYNPNGTLDTAFNGTGYVSFNRDSYYHTIDFGLAIIQDSSGNIVVAGQSVNLSDCAGAMIWRFKNNGTLDTSFNAKGWNLFCFVGPYERFSDIVEDASGNYVMTGAANRTSPNGMLVARVKHDGSLDNSFNDTGYFYRFSEAGGPEDAGYRLALDYSGRIVVAGESKNATNRYGVIWRIIDDCPSRMFSPTQTLTPGLAVLFTITATNTPFTGTVTITPTRTRVSTGTATPSITCTPSNTATNSMTQVATPPCYLSQWGSIGSGNGGFFNPNGLAFDASGDVYVVDTSNSRVEKFTPSGGYISQWGTGGMGNGQFNGPIGIARDSGGNFYVVDSSNARVEKFDASGTYISQWGIYGSGNGQLYFPAGIAIDSAGYIYIVDSSNNRVQKFTSAGVYDSTIGSAGIGDGQFNTPYGIAIGAGGNIYIADTMNNRIEVFSPAGGFIAKWGALGTGDGQFNHPQGIAVDSAGNVYVTDSNNNRIQEFTAAGVYLTQWGGLGNGAGQFKFPVGIAIDSGDNIYITDTHNGRVEKFGPCAATFTYTPTITLTQGNTFTNTPSYTFTPSCTATLSHTATQSYTATVSKTQTSTPSRTPSATPSVTQTKTPTCTQSKTVTPTYTLTMTPSAVPSATFTPTPTAIPYYCLELKGAFPNPAYAYAGIVYNVCGDPEVEVVIYTVSGEKVRVLKQKAAPGWNTVFWDMKNSGGKRSSSGVFIYRLVADYISEKKEKWGKVAVVK